MAFWENTDTGKQITKAARIFLITANKVYAELETQNRVFSYDGQENSGVKRGS
jgi:hypothetical protein